MTPDPHTSVSPAVESEHDRQARLEELLLSGLDHYFAGQHELAINVWTRALFIDRGHARARAYIERARSAIAERQREGEELLHSGAAAFHRGDAQTARGLLRQAVEHGVGTEEALVLLERLDRLEAASVPDSRIQRREPPRTAVSDPAVPGPDRSWLGWIAAGAVLGFASAAVAIGMLWARGELKLPFDQGPPAEVATRVHDEPLPVPTASGVALARAQAQYERGHLRDALLALDAIGPGDPLSADADQLKATIQSKLLEAARMPPPDAKAGTPVRR